MGDQADLTRACSTTWPAVTPGSASRQHQRPVSYRSRASTPAFQLDENATLFWVSNVMLTGPSLNICELYGFQLVPSDSSV
jgi:hypothetical protein